MNAGPGYDRGAESVAGLAGVPHDAHHATDLEKVATGGGINLLGSVTRAGFTFIYAVFLAAFLDPARVGLFFLGFTILTLLGTAATLGLDTGVLRFTALHYGEGNRLHVRGTMVGAIAVAVPAGLMAGIALFATSGWLANDLFSKPDLAPVLKFFSFSIPLFVIAKIFNSGTQGLRHMQYQVYSRDLGEQIAKIVLSLALLFAGLGLMGVVGANFGALVIATLLSIVFFQKLEPMFGRGLRRKYEERRLLLYSAPLALSALLALLLIWTDTLFLGYFRPSEDVGTYVVAMRLAKVGAIFLVSFNTMFAPFASDFFNRGERERLERLLQSVTKWIIGLSFPLFAGLALFPTQVLSIFGVSYTIGAGALVILAIGQMIDSAAGPVAHLLMMCDRPRLMLANNLLVFLTNVGLCLILIPRYGIIGAAMTSAITVVLFNLGVMTVSFFLLKLQPFSLGYMKVVGSGAVAVVLALVIQRLLPGSWSFVASLVTFLVTYPVLAFWVAFDSSDFSVITSLKSKLTNKQIRQVRFLVKLSKMFAANRADIP